MHKVCVHKVCVHKVNEKNHSGHEMVLLRVWKISDYLIGPYLDGH